MSTPAAKRKAKERKRDEMRELGHRVVRGWLVLSDDDLAQLIDAGLMPESAVEDDAAFMRGCSALLASLAYELTAIDARAVLTVLADRLTSQRDGS